ncbi:MAG TPA: discoidin domain-containing protein [Micromonosporaceae bacterium]|nr:discoidin domain-containing protein [Micromonosporaceae bacterium]
MVAGRLSRRWIGLLGAVGLGLAGTAVAVGLTAPPASAATDLALGKTATASSAQGARPAPMANDGNATTRWCAATGATGQWLQIDLGSATSLGGTQVVWEFARNYKYQISVSSDGSTFTTVSDKTANTSAVQTQADTFVATGRYVRITITGLPTDVVTWASIFTFSVFGTDTTPSTPPTTPADPVAGPPTSAAARAACTGTNPIMCTYGALPPGNYNVTVVLGDANSAGVTQVSGEARRALLAPVTTRAGEFKRFSFTVNVRFPEGHPTAQKGYGVNGLNMIFSGSAPKLNAIGYAAAPQPRSLFLIGDSTVVDQEDAPYSGWGQHLPPYFKLGLAVSNYADSGESSATAVRNSALFPAVRERIRPGDYVFIQMGHNDKQAQKNDYKANLTSMVKDTTDAGGVAVLVTQPVRRWFTGTQLNATGLGVNGLSVDLPAAMREVARDTNAPLIDLAAKSEALVESLGPTNSGRIYLTTATDGVDDKTHFSTYGGQEMARLVVQGITELKLNPLSSYLR